MWIHEVSCDLDNDDEAGVREMLARDPYYATPGVTEVSLREWDLLPLSLR